MRVYYWQLVAQVMRNSRELAGLTQAGISQRVGASRSAVQAMESSGARLTAERMCAWSGAVGRTHVSLIQEIEERKRRLEEDGWEVVLDRSQGVGG